MRLGTSICLVMFLRTAPPDFDPVTLEDADATFAVVKADGTTPYPGADGEADGNNIILTLIWPV